MLFHQGQDGLALTGAGVAEAHVPFNVGGQAQLFDAQLGIAALAVADDEQAVFLCQLFQGFPDIGVADLAGVLEQVLIFRGHAPLHQVVPLRNVDGGQQNIGDFRHGFAEEGL